MNIVATRRRPGRAGILATLTASAGMGFVFAPAIQAADAPKDIVDTAVAAGATAAAPEASGDIVTPKGVSVWLDAGPVRHTDPIDGIGVLHTVAVEHRSFATPAPNVSDADLAPDQAHAVEVVVKNELLDHGGLSLSGQARGC